MSRLYKYNNNKERVLLNEVTNIIEFPIIKSYVNDNNSEVMLRKQIVNYLCEKLEITADEIEGYIEIT
jgi:adenylate cyclase class IV